MPTSAQTSRNRSRTITTVPLGSVRTSLEIDSSIPGHNDNRRSVEFANALRASFDQARNAPHIQMSSLGDRESNAPEVASSASQSGHSTAPEHHEFDEEINPEKSIWDVLETRKAKLVAALLAATATAGIASIVISLGTSRAVSHESGITPGESAIASSRQTAGPNTGTDANSATGTIPASTGTVNIPFAASTHQTAGGETQVAQAPVYGTPTGRVSVHITVTPTTQTPPPDYGASSGFETITKTPARN